MNTIIKKERLSEQVLRYRIRSPKIAAKRKAGQFIILRADEDGERIPLTIANANPSEGWIEIIFQIAGHGTKDLAALNEGSKVPDIAGPLGRPTHIAKYGRCICIGGGVGVAPLFPIVKALKESDNDVTVVIGARSEKLIILEEDMKLFSNHLHIATDDGSRGTHGFVSDVFNTLWDKGERYDFAVVIGPPVMMKVTSTLTVKQGIKTFVSLNPIMIDGTGMCGGCRVTVFGETKFGCVDGPEFDASGIDWDEMIRRLGAYRDFEHNYTHTHQCKILEQETPRSKK